jgi:hypothetical protein
MPIGSGERIRKVLRPAAKPARADGAGVAGLREPTASSDRNTVPRLDSDQGTGPETGA